MRGIRPVKTWGGYGGGVAYVNRRWGNPAGTQHSPMLTQKAVYMRTLPG